MKKTIAFIALAAFVGVANAEYPPLTVDGHVVIDQDYHVVVEPLDIGDADILNSQYNHEALQSNVVNIHKNRVIDGDVIVDTTTVGNNFTLNVDGDRVVQNVQGNQEGGQYSHVDIHNNRITGEVHVTTTTIGNNASLTADRLDVDNVQFNHYAGNNTEVFITNNRFGDVPLDPSVDLTLVGNNLSVSAGSVGMVSTHQQQEDSHNMARIEISGNRGSVGPVNVGSTVIGNNVSIGQ